MFKKILNHRHGALVMGDHQGQEEPVEIGPFEFCKPRHVLGARHAGHFVRHMHGGVHSRFRHCLPSVAEPACHELDLVDL